MKAYPEKVKDLDGKQIIVWRVVYYTSGERHRKTFKSEEDANKWIRSEKTFIVDEGTKSLHHWNRFRASDRLDIIRADALRKEKGCNASMAEAMKYYLAHGYIEARNITIDAANREYIFEKTRSLEKHKSNSGYINVITASLGKFSRAFCQALLRDIDTRQIEGWLDDQGWESDTTYNNYCTYLKMFFGWAVGEKYIKENPVDKIRKIAVEDEEIVVPSPSDVTKIFRESELHPDWGMTPYFTLLFGFGLRSAEAVKADWSEISLSEGFIKVLASKAKTKARRVISIEEPMKSSFASFLLSYQKDSGAIVPENYSWLREKICKEAGVPWVRNMGRKAFASYHYAHLQNDSKTRQIIGHVGDGIMFVQHYRAVDMAEGGVTKTLTKAHAEAYWKISMESVTKGDALQRAA